MTKRLQKEGWDIAYVRNWYGKRFFLQTSEELGKRETIFGWKEDPRLASHVRKMLALRDMAAITSLHRSGLITQCDYDGPTKLTDKDELLECDLSDGVRRRMKRVEFECTVETYSWRNDAAFDLQEPVFRAIAEMSRGVIHFTETCTFYLPSEPYLW